METRTLFSATPEQDACELSPVWEEGSPTPLNTHWIPLHELIAHWTATDTVLLPAPVAPLLTAIGHALFALARETRALRFYNLAWEKQQWHAPASSRASPARSRNACGRWSRKCELTRSAE